MTRKKDAPEPQEAPDATEIGEDPEVVAQRAEDMVNPADMVSVEERQARQAEANPTPTSQPVGDPAERLGPGVEPETSGASLVDKGLVPSDQVLSDAPDLASRMAHENTTGELVDDPNRVPEAK